MVEGLLGALILIAIICVIGTVFVKFVPMPAPVPTIIWAIVAILCLVILYRAVVGTNLL